MVLLGLLTLMGMVRAEQQGPEVAIILLAVVVEVLTVDLLEKLSLLEAQAAVEPELLTEERQYQML